MSGEIGVPPSPFQLTETEKHDRELVALDHEIRKAEHTYDWLVFVRERRAGQAGWKRK